MNRSGVASRSSNRSFSTVLGDVTQASLSFLCNPKPLLSLENLLFGCLDDNKNGKLKIPAALARMQTTATDELSFGLGLFNLFAVPFNCLTQFTARELNQPQVKRCRRCRAHVGHASGVLTRGR